mmetsp:Transcript_26059/g.53373  ORF Transcript_26059/g.53373 Transcript_26059/m.53373 type:complete len:280 (+) Transcript_26059:236-1075(+)
MPSPPTHRASAPPLRLSHALALEGVTTLISTSRGQPPTQPDSGCAPSACAFNVVVGVVVVIADPPLLSPALSLVLCIIPPPPPAPPPDGDDDDVDASAASSCSMIPTMTCAVVWPRPLRFAQRWVALKLSVLGVNPSAKLPNEASRVKRSSVAYCMSIEYSLWSKKSFFKLLSPLTCRLHRSPLSLFLRSVQTWILGGKRCRVPLSLLSSSASMRSPSMWNSSLGSRPVSRFDDKLSSVKLSGSLRPLEPPNGPVKLLCRKLKLVKRVKELIDPPSWGA